MSDQSEHVDPFPALTQMSHLLALAAFSGGASNPREVRALQETFELASLGLSPAQLWEWLEGHRRRLEAECAAVAFGAIKVPAQDKSIFHDWDDRLPPDAPGPGPDPAI